MADIVLILTLIFVSGLYIGHRIGVYDAEKKQKKMINEQFGGKDGRHY